MLEWGKRLVFGSRFSVLGGNRAAIGWPPSADRLPETANRIPLTANRLPLTANRLPLAANRIPPTANQCVGGGVSGIIGRQMGAVLLDAGDMRRTLGRMAHEILEANQGAEDLVVVGILRRGWPIAKRLAFLMTQIEGTTVPCGKLDIRSYRDDRPTTPEGEDATEIPFSVADKTVILVDEVVYTGRTTRAALDALMSHGRPKAVRLAVLIDRGHRELPIEPDYCGRKFQTDKGDHIVVKVNEYDGEDAVVLEKSTIAGSAA